MNDMVSKRRSGADGPGRGGNSPRQVAALCRRDVDGRPRVLLVTSRETRRWILPKGWPMPGRSDGEAALIEAWEEAGVRGRLESPRPVGRFSYEKRMKDGTSRTVETEVFAVRVSELAEDYPEAGQRRRKWVSPEKAAQMVEEAPLKAFLAGL